MVTSMTEQPGRPHDQADRRGADRQAKNVDLFGDLQRWFIRQSAKNMRREISGQVRRTLGGGREASDVWDTATNEIPPEVGESPECQWCPICRAARRMRDSGPGIGGQLTGAGDVVASAVHDAIGVLDSLLARTSGTGATKGTGSGGTGSGGAGSGAVRPGSGGEDGPGDQGGPGDDAGSAEHAGSAGGGSGRDPEASDADARDADASDAEASDAEASDAEAGEKAPSPGARLHRVTGPDDQDEPGASGERHARTSDSRRSRPGLVGLPGGVESAAKRPGSDPVHSGPASGAAARRTAAPGKKPDPWGAATGPAAAGRDSDADAQPGRPGYGPDDRG